MKCVNFENVLLEIIKIFNIVKKDSKKITQLQDMSVSPSELLATFLNTSYF